MSDRVFPESVSAVRELRPAEDLSLLHAHELRQLFETETVRPSSLADPRPVESFHAISAPLLIEPSEDPPPMERPDVALQKAESPGPSAAVEVHRDTPPEAPKEAAPPRRDWLMRPEPLAGAGETQPYGDDPVRVRELVQWFADGRAASSNVQVQRAAGDLLDVPSDTRDRPARVRPVVSGERIA